MHDFRALSDVEFEDLVGDLLSESLDIHFERFRRAPDGGVDLRATRSGVHIVQCKHYVRSKYSDLLRDLKAEVPNVEREDPATYRVATSFELTRTQVDEIYSLFQNWMPDTSHVLGFDSLDSLIGRCPHIERRHTKLWLSSGNMLAAGMNASIFHRSAHLRLQILEALPLYVESRALDRASRILEEQRVCIISGPPGIGKTTLARILLAQSIQAGYEPIEVSHDVEEAWKAFDPRAPQAFYYDDFLGRISLGERLLKNEDHRLVQFIDRVARSESKLLVLTTREYILREARQSYEELSRLDERLKIVLELEDYTRLERAKILYNHLWHSDLSREDLWSILDDQNYLRIIDHPNYSPRLIQYITSSPVIRGDTREADSGL